MKIQMKMQMNKAVKPSTNQADSLAITATPSTVATQASLTTRTRASCHAAHGWFKTLWLSAALAFAAGSAIADQGVSSNEILLGTIQDLSGPLAGYGKAVRNGMQMRMDEINEQGGVNGRKLRLVTEDSGYDPKRAVLAAQKLVNQDKIFMMLAHIGTAQNNAAMPVLFDKNIVNFMPVTAAREMYEPLNRLKYANFATYYDQMRSALPILIKEKKLTKICVIHQDDEFGLEVFRGAETAMKTLNMEFAEKTSFKRGATDFSSQVARMKSAGCEMVVLGTIIRETVGTIAEARKNGFNPLFIGSSAAYSDLIHKLGGKATEGMYATMTVPHPYLDEASKPIAAWAGKYKAKFTDDPTVLSVYGYVIVDAFIRGAQKAGPNLTTDSFIKAMDTMTLPTDIFGSPEGKFTPTQRLSSNRSRLSQIQDGRWKIISGYFE
jgi:branched-chain amino acid transport system substrate-binding protein